MGSPFVVADRPRQNLGFRGVQTFSAWVPVARENFFYQEFQGAISAMLIASDLSLLDLIDSSTEHVVVVDVLGGVLLAANPRYSVSVADSPNLQERADERHLMERVAEKDEQSLLTIYDRYSLLAYKLVFHVLRDPSAAEDIVQDIFLQVWREPKAYDSKRGSLSAWIAIVARNRAVDYWRKHRRESRLSKSLQLVEPIGRPEFQDIEKVRAILARLPASQRDILELSYFGGLSHSEIVSRTGLPLGTVKSRIRQALQNVRHELVPDAIGRRTGKSKSSNTARIS